MVKVKTTWNPTTPNDFKRIRRDLLKLKNGGIYSSGDVFFLNDVLHFYINKKFDASIDLVTKDLFLNVLANARMYSPGTEVILSAMIAEETQQKNLRNMRLSSRQALDETKSFLTDQKSKEIFEEVISLMGTSGRVHVTEEPISATELVLRDLHNVPIFVEPRFATQIGFDKRLYDFANVCIIEGAPSSVSEINNLLSYCHERNVFLLLLARSFPEEVVNTLAVNWQRKKLSILPLVYGTKISNINAHADLSAISGAIPVNSSTGTTGLTSNLSKSFGTLTNIRLDSKGLNATGSVDPHPLVKDLKEKLSNLDLVETDKRQMILERLAGLSSKTLHVKIQKSPKSWHLKNELEIGLALYNDFCRGATEVINLHGDKLVYPSNVYKKAKEMHNTYTRLTEQIGGYVVLKKTKNVNK